jgi:hypothetical protein
MKRILIVLMTSGVLLCVGCGNDSNDSGSGSNSGATAVCNDGSLSFSKSVQGTCSGHGGVKEWVNKPGN